MNRTFAHSERAVRALALTEALQERFVAALEKAGGVSFESVEWFRDEGQHGGGRRFGVKDTELLGRASVNVSQVHYDDDPARRLGSASAISTIVHPVHPLAPSAHIHISWTEQKNGIGYWRIMADLNPSIASAADKECFAGALRQAAPQFYTEAVEQGDRYFYIPALNRYRGIVHFYLESFSSGDFEKD
ncbi:MAG TPA: coproporphyrinogen III oxidase, partial [Pontiella sp.]|nr:coproporphyrinogen III oxidase [Pontiella sp.]